MKDQLLIITSIFLFLLVGFIAKNRKVKTIDGFSTRRNQLSWFVTSAGVSMTFVGGAALINMAQLGYLFSWYTLIDPISLTLGILIAIFFVKKYRQDKGITISQLLSSDYKHLSLFIGIITSTMFLLIVSAQFVAFSKLLAPYFPKIHPIILILIPSAIMLLYVFWGGFSAVTNTDVLQLFFIFVFLIFPVVYFLINSDIPISTGDIPLAFAPMPVNLILLLSVSVLFIPVSQDINIRAKSAKNDRHAKLGLFFGALFYSTVVIASSYIGILLARHGVKLDDPEQAFPTFFIRFFPTIGIFSVLAGMAAIWSTLDTYLVNGITSITQDILKKNPFLSKINDGKLIIISGVFIYTFAMLAGIIFHQVLSLILTSLLIYISILIPIAIAKKLNINDKYILVLSILTIVLIIGIEVFQINLNPKAIFYPLLGMILMLIGYIFEKVTIKKA